MQSPAVDAETDIDTEIVAHHRTRVSPRGVDREVAMALPCDEGEVATYMLLDGSYLGLRLTFAMTAVACRTQERQQILIERWIRTKDSVRG